MKEINILIVEDEYISAMFMSLQLKMAGINVSKVVSTGEEAIAYAIKEKPNFILMDIRIAGALDGIETAKKILAIYKCNIIFMTGYENIEIYERAKALEPTGYLIKPFDISKVLQLINSALQ